MGSEDDKAYDKARDKAYRRPSSSTVIALEKPMGSEDDKAYDKTRDKAC